MQDSLKSQDRTSMEFDEVVLRSHEIFFKKTLDYIVLSPGFSYNYTLPDSEDLEGNAYTINVALGKALVFTTYKYSVFTF